MSDTRRPNDREHDAWTGSWNGEAYDESWDEAWDGSADATGDLAEAVRAGRIRAEDTLRPAVDTSAARRSERRGGDVEAAPLTRRQARQKAEGRSGGRGGRGAAAVPPKTDRKPPKKSGPLGYLREIAIVLIAAVLLSWAVKTFLVQPFWIPTPSMATTLEVGDRVMVSKLTPETIDLHRGDVVVFKDPGNWLNGADSGAPQKSPPNWLQEPLQFVGLAPETGEKYLIKRVIGLPGDRIDGVAGQPLRINGEAIDEPYLNADSEPTSQDFHVVVPEGRIWVMGDHRAQSGDSRFHDDGTGKTGSVPITDVVGRAIMVVWPLGRGKWVDNYQPVFAHVPAPGGFSAPPPDPAAGAGGDSAPKNAPESVVGTVAPPLPSPS